MQPVIFGHQFSFYAWKILKTGVRPNLNLDKILHVSILQHRFSRIKKKLNRNNKLKQ